MMDVPIDSKFKWGHLTFFKIGNNKMKSEYI